jgi:acyl transferase domain-containing protein
VALTWAELKASVMLQVGVYVGSSGSLVNPEWDMDDVTGMSPCAGSTLSAFASRLSCFYDFKGPSKTVDTGKPCINPAGCAAVPLKVL